MKKFFNWIKSPSSDFALFIILLVLINVVSHNSFARIDLTEPKSYSLSKASKQVVKNLQEPLSVRVFFDESLPSPYNTVSQYVNDLLSEYKGSANSNFSVMKMDLSKPQNAQMAADYGLRQIQIQEIKNNEVGFKQVYMGLVVTYGDSIKLIDGITSADGFEYRLTSTISGMINTADTLASLKNEDKINVTLYLSEALKGMGISGCSELEDTFKKAFSDANSQNKDRLQLQIIHPANSETSEIVEKYGLQGIQYKDSNGMNQLATLGVVVEHKDSFRVLPVQVGRSLFGYVISGIDGLSELINESLQSLVSNVKSVGYITGHGERALDDQNESANFDVMISAHYELRELSLKEDDIPANMNSIIINGPKEDYEEIELYKIDQFIMRGGNVIFFMDPFIENNQMAMYGYGMPSYEPNVLNIDKLLEKYGIKRNADYIMDKNCYSSSSQQYGKLPLYWIPIVQKNQLPQKSVITKNLGYLIFLQDGSLDLSQALDNSDLKTTVLAKSSEKSWIQSENIILNPQVINVPSESEMKSYPLAVILEGKFNSAYESKPDFDSENTSLSETLKTDNHISVSRQPGKVFIAGSSYITTYQILDGAESSPMSMFLMNIIDYMNGNEDLCTMRSKGLSVNTLTIKSAGLAALVKYFNQFGLVLLVVLTGLIVWRSRVKRRKLIRNKYNPNDTRQD